MLINIPELKIVPIGSLLPHESYDPYRVERIIKKLNSENVLKNPVIVTPVKDKFLILDGVTRVTALKEMGCKSALVQLVDYDTPEVKLDAWNHILFNINGGSFISKLKKIKGLILENTTKKRAEKMLSKKELAGYLVLKDNKVISLRYDSTVSNRIDFLNKIVGVYNHSEIYRTNSKEIESLINKYENLYAIFVMPKFSKEELKEFALKKLLTPCGITKHIIPNRVLRFNLDISLLKSDLSLGDLNQKLSEEIKKKLEHKEIRFYSEHVFIFDE